MNVSQKGIELIAGFEGLRLNAYLDPVDIPTIGYGTIRYPDGNPVKLGDRITEDQAEVFLAHEAQGMAKDIAAVVAGIALNQNQFDALVSFTYNVGVGAFRSSTLLARLEQSDFAGAAAEFGRWNKATVGGVKVVLPGLTKRRQDERALFESTAPAGDPLPDEVSPEERAVALVGFRDGDKHVIVAEDSAGAAIDILEVASNDVDVFGKMLRQYPNAKRFRIADAGEEIPDGERTEFVIRERIKKRAKRVPKLDQDLLVRGSDDAETDKNDVAELQRQLQDLGFYVGPVDGDFGSGTDDAVRRFQAEIFGHAEADGKVGPLTWEKLFGADQPKEPKPTGEKRPGLNYLLLTKTNRRDEHGLTVLDFAYYKDGQRQDSMAVCSGVRSKQFFRTAANSFSGTFEPIHEGRWTISDIAWRDGRDNYRGRVWKPGLGPAKIFMCYEGPGTSRRSHIEIHIDWNRSGSPGSAGCITTYDVAGFKRLVGWLRDTDPRSLYVDFGHGTCPEPKAPEATSDEAPCVWDANGR